MPRNLGFLETFPVLAALPTSSGSGRIVTLSTDGHPYFDHTTGWRLLDAQPPAVPGDMLKSTYDTNNDGRIDAGALGTGTPTAGTYLNGTNAWAVLPQISNPPVLDAQSSLFSRLYNGSINAQQGFTLSGAATATVSGPQVLAVGNFGNQADYTLSPREFTTGTIRFQAQAGAAGNFMFVWGLPRTGLPTANFALWCAGGTAGSNLEFGWVTYNPNAGVTSAASVGNIVPAGRYTVEIIHRGQAAGNVTEIRMWAESVNRPVTATFIYTFLGTEPAIVGTRIGLRSISTNTVSYANLEVYDSVTALRNVVTPSGYWFPYAYNGRTVLVTVNQGARLDCAVQGTLNFTLNVTGHSAATYQPKVAFRIDGGPIIYRTVPGVGAQSLTIAMPDTALHRVSIVAAGIHEADAVWVDAQGLLVNGVSVDAGGQVSRIVDDRPLLAVFGDSITAGIVAYGLNGAAPVSTPSQSAGELAYPTILASRLNMRVNGHGFGGSGVTVGGNGNVPKAILNVLNYQGSVPLFGEDIPAIALINENTNDGAQAAGTVQTDYLAFVDALRARYAGLRILIMRPLNGTQAVVNSAVASLRALQYVDTSAWAGVTYADGGTHPDPAGHQRVAELLYPAVVVVPVMQLVTAITGAYTAQAGDSLLKADATSAAFTVTLPSAVGISGKSYTLKKTDASVNAVTLATTSSQTIDGGATAILSTQYLSLTVISDGANWSVV